MQNHVTGAQTQPLYQGQVQKARCATSVCYSSYAINTYCSGTRRSPQYAHTVLLSGKRISIYMYILIGFCFAINQICSVLVNWVFRSTLVHYHNVGYLLAIVVLGQRANRICDSSRSCVNMIKYCIRAIKHIHL